MGNSQVCKFDSKRDINVKKTNMKMIIFQFWINTTDMLKSDFCQSYQLIGFIIGYLVLYIVSYLLGEQPSNALESTAIHAPTPGLYP